MFNKKMNFGILVITIIVITVFVASVYYLNNLIPKKIELKDLQTQEKSDFEVVDMQKGKIFSKIIVKKKINNLEIKKYRNYTLGEGENYYLNYQIVIENEEKNYLVKTAVYDMNTTDKFNKLDKENYVYLKAVFLNKDFFEKKYKISIIQQDYQDNYKNKTKLYYKNIGTVGDINEKNI